MVTTDRIISADEDVFEGTFSAKCPFCHKVNHVNSNEEGERCMHFKGLEHGCGGTVFTFTRKVKG